MLWTGWNTLGYWLGYALDWIVQCFTSPRRQHNYRLWETVFTGQEDPTNNAVSLYNATHVNTEHLFNIGSCCGGRRQPV